MYLAFKKLKISHTECLKSEKQSTNDDYGGSNARRSVRLISSDAKLHEVRPG